MTISESIRTIAEKQNVTISQLERDLNFNKGTIRRWQESEPSIEKVCRVADYLNVSVDEICGRGFTSTPLTEGFVHELQHDLSDDENLIIQKFRTLSDADKVKFLFTMLGFEK